MANIMRDFSPLGIVVIYYARHYSKMFQWIIDSLINYVIDVKSY